MADHPFDRDLVPRVLADATFRRTGVYTGKDLPHRYAVLDPRRRNVGVWTKRHDTEFRPTQYARYRNMAKARGGVFATNGPPMDPPDLPGSGAPSGGARLYAGFAASMASGDPWVPFDAVRCGGREVDAGRGFRTWHFARTGQGSISSYAIGEGSARGDESLSGCYGIVASGAVVESGDHDGLVEKRGCAAWCIRPLTPGAETTQWESEVPWFPEAMDEEAGAPRPLAGVVIAVVTWREPDDLAATLVAVGCSHAVAMDGSTSIVCVRAGALRPECERRKDLVQRWGLYFV